MDLTGAQMEATWIVAAIAELEFEKAYVVGDLTAMQDAGQVWHKCCSDLARAGLLLPDLEEIPRDIVDR